MCEVPTAQVADVVSQKRNFGPSVHPRSLTVLESKALQLAQALKEEADIPWSSIGISGSIMAGLTNEKSDIDQLVYGVENSRKAYAALQKLLKPRILASNPTAERNSRRSSTSVRRTPR